MLLGPLVLLSQLLPVLGAPAKRAIAPITDGATINGKAYDYVVVGGGLAGVVVASRLSEDAGKTVLVIEAGRDEEGNTNVTDASKYQSTFGSALDWAYETVPQTSANGKSTVVRSGRALGGSTTINGMAWTKPHTFQLDAMETVGNDGLNWNSLEPYMRRAENASPPSDAQLAAGVTFAPSCHSTGGPIGVQITMDKTNPVMPTDLEHNFNTTCQNLGLPYVTDLSCGNPAGLATVLHTRVEMVRSDAYRGYLWGKTRPNLTILTGANVGKVLLSSGSTPRATGVEFQDEKNATYTVNASLEVIMAAGAIKTPIILQHSGVGPKSVLQAAGVEQLVDLPIGQNLIDQVTVTTSWAFSGNRGGGMPITFPRFQDMLDGEDATTARNMLQNDLASYAEDAVKAGAASSAAALLKVLELQRDWILNKNSSMSENFEYSYGTTLGYDSWFLLPFGRGSVQIKNNQAYSADFSIDPRFFSNPFDRLASAATERFTRTVSSSEPLKNSITAENGPGTTAVPTGASLDDWDKWVVDNYRSNWHPVGTASMMSRDMGGSVDSRNRLYGVDALRIVDASIIPFQMSCHLMSVLYGLSERAAELIQADHSADGPSTSVLPSASSPATPTASASSSGRRTCTTRR